ncbi:MAG: rRNA maturation RNase YbeY [Bacteroidota bacterium]
MTQRMILISTNHPHLRFSSGDVLRALYLVYRGEGKELPSLAIVFTHNRSIRKMNRDFLKHDYVTDVIAFPLGEDGGVEGEIYINLDAVRKQAREYGVTYTQESRRLLIHGALHLLGYDDTTRGRKKKMSEREDIYLELMKKKKRK